MHKIYFDGGTRLNATALYDEDLNFYDHRKIEFRMTNNQLEYMAMFSAMEYASSIYNLSECCFVGDSQVIIEQMRGDYDVVNPGLQILNKKVVEFIVNLIGHLPTVDMFEWVRREHNYAGVYLEKLG